MEYYISYIRDQIYQSLIVEAPGPKAAERYLLSKMLRARVIEAREARLEDYKPGIPVLELSAKEQAALRSAFLAQDLSELDLSARSYNALRLAHTQTYSGLRWEPIKTIGDLVALSEEKIGQLLDALPMDKSRGFLVR